MTTAAIAAVAFGVATTARPDRSARLRAIGPQRPHMLSGSESRPRPKLVAATGCLCMLWLLGGLRLTSAVAVVAATVVVVVRRRDRRRVETELRTGTVELCRAVAAELRCGQPPDRALFRAATNVPSALRAHLNIVMTATSSGDPAAVSSALAVAAQLPALHGLRALAACWQVAAGTGARFAGAIERVADAIHDDVEVRRDLDSLLAGARTSVRLLAALPLLGILLGVAIGANPLRFLTHTALGAGCCVFAVALDVGGLVWMTHIARRARPAS